MGVLHRFDGHEQVMFGRDDESGLQCVIAIHSTRLGPAVGGTRFRAYDDEDAAVTDVLRLSRAMTLKTACAGLDTGGGKGVIIGDPGELRSEALLRAYGRMIASLGGRYVTACDVGTTPDDMTMIGRETRFVTGKDPAEGGSGDSGILTAVGVHLAMQASAATMWGEPTLKGRHVAVQGLGKVGRRLVGHLVEEGAKVTVADVSEAAVAQVADLDDVSVVDPDKVMAVDAEVFSPNALGAVLTEASIESLQAKIVCGGANNQLASEHDAQRLIERGVLYAPDFVVNAGGIINLLDELHPGGYSQPRALRRVEAIGDTLQRVFALAHEQRITTEDAAVRVAEARIGQVGDLRGFLL